MKLPHHTGQIQLLMVIWLLVTHAALGQSLTPADLSQGGYVLYFRHANADRGRDCKDPLQTEWWRSDKPELTRQLTEQGKLQASVIGQAFRSLGLEVDTVQCSEFRRAQDTASRFGLGPANPNANLTPLASLGPLEPRLVGLLNKPPAQGKNTVLVAHGHVLPMFEDLSEGDAVAFRPGSEPLQQGVIRYQEWVEAAGSLLFESLLPDDRFSLRDEVLTIHSSRGIGRVTLRPINGEWPPLRRLRFEYGKGGGMKVLEGLDLKTDVQSIRHQYRVHDLTKTVRDGALEVLLPTELPQTRKYLEIHWVDFYR
jgi:phosphohistidine phosphatase SixA